jgi:hypothetical protein
MRSTPPEVSGADQTSSDTAALVPTATPAAEPAQEGHTP